MDVEELFNIVNYVPHYCYLAAKEAGYTQTQIENHLNISRIGVRNCILRGEKMIDKCQEIWQKMA